MPSRPGHQLRKRIKRATVTDSTHLHPRLVNSRFSTFTADHQQIQPSFPSPFATSSSFSFSTSSETPTRHTPRIPEPPYLASFMNMAMTNGYTHGPPTYSPYHHPSNAGGPFDTPDPSSAGSSEPRRPRLAPPVLGGYQHPGMSGLPPFSGGGGGGAGGPSGLSVQYPSNHTLSSGLDHEDDANRSRNAKAQRRHREKRKAHVKNVSYLSPSFPWFIITLLKAISHHIQSSPLLPQPSFPSPRRYDPQALTLPTLRLEIPLEKRKLTRNSWKTLSSR